MTQKINQLAWYEQVRKRPAMYTGSLTVHGFSYLLKYIYSAQLTRLNPDSIILKITNDNSAILSISGIKNQVQDNWSKWNFNHNQVLEIELQTLNALSKAFNIELLNKNKDLVLEQVYQKGKLVMSKDQVDQLYTCTDINIQFTLDKDIWRTDFKDTKPFISHEINEFAYLHKKVVFKVLYSVGNDTCKNIYSFKNGLKDKLEKIKLHTPKFSIIQSQLDTYLDLDINNFHVEVAFAYQIYGSHVPFFESYVNDQLTMFNGTHIDGVVKGLVLGTQQYLKESNLTMSHKATTRGIKKNLIAFINIRINKPNFLGATKSKLGNKEIVKPLKDHIAPIFLQRLHDDQDISRKFIDVFQI